MLENLETVLNEKVRPLLAQHDGDLQIVRFENGVLYFRMLGKCSGCPSAVVTAEELVAPPIMEALPEVKQVVLDTSVSDELWATAKQILKSRHQAAQ